SLPCVPTRSVGTRSRSRFSVVCFVSVLALAPARAEDYDELKVGVQPDGRIVVPTNQILKPAGQQVTFPGRPVDLAWCDDGKTIVVKNMRDLVYLDPATGKIRQTLNLPQPRAKDEDKAGFSVVGIVVRGDRIYATDVDSQVRVAARQADGKYDWDKPIELALPKVGGKAHGSGLTLVGDNELWVLSTRGNDVQRIALDSGKVVQRIAVGVSPFRVCFAGPDKCYVSNWGGDPPKEGEPQALSSKTPIRIDPRTGVANSGTVSVLERVGDEWKQVRTIAVGLHPSALIL